MTTTQIDKTSPNAVAVRGDIRRIAVEVYEKSDELSDFIELLANRIDRAAHLVDGDREDTHELAHDLRAAAEMLARVQAKAGLVARRTKN